MYACIDWTPAAGIIRDYVAVCQSCELSLNHVVTTCKVKARNGVKTHQNHSLPKLGTEKTPQCMKMPNLAWSYHSGSGLESMDFQFGSYFARAVPKNSIDETK